jgi:hypothetical protein
MLEHKYPESITGRENMRKLVVICRFKMGPLQAVSLRLDPIRSVENEFPRSTRIVDRTAVFFGSPSLKRGGDMTGNKRSAERGLPLGAGIHEEGEKRRCPDNI